jgi:hypothetical protein
MVTTADTYRHFAEECLRWAEETDNEEHRQACLDMAVIWLRLATTGPNGEPPSQLRRRAEWCALSADRQSRD